MVIEKFKKDKGNTYKIYFDDGIIISLYDDVIVKYNLLSNKRLDNKLFNEITSYNDFLNGYYKSIKYINKKLRSKLEIEKYLAKLNIKTSDINKIIKLLYKDGYLNDYNYIKAYINDKYNLSNDGPEKIKKDLITLGFNINEFIDYLNNMDWYKKLEIIIDKKIKINHNLSNSGLKTKLLYDLTRIGYSKEEILEILESKNFNDEDILKKEYNKIYNKYSKKYKEKELEYKIIKYLCSKGFNIDDIKKVKYED